MFNYCTSRCTYLTMKLKNLFRTWFSTRSWVRSILFFIYTHILVYYNEFTRLRKRTNVFRVVTRKFYFDFILRENRPCLRNQFVLRSPLPKGGRTAVLITSVACRANVGRPTKIAAKTGPRFKNWRKFVAVRNSNVRRWRRLLEFHLRSL